MHPTYPLDQNLVKVLNSFDDYVFVIDQNGTIVFANHASVRKLGYTLEEFLDMNVLEVHPDDQRIQTGIIVRNMLLGIEKTSAVPLVTKSGELVPVETKVSEIVLNEKNFILGVSRDISAWILANHRLSQSEEKFKKSFDLSARMMAISDFETGVYVDVNEQFALTMGLSKSEIIGKTATTMQFFDADSRERIIGMLERGDSVRGEEVNLTIAHQNKTIRCSCDSVTFELNGHRYLLSSAEDITEKKKNETALANSERQLSLVLDGTDEGFWDWQIKTGVVEFSRRWAEMIGYELHEIEHNVSFWEDIVHPDDKLHVFAEVEKHIKGETVRYQTEHRVRTKDGSWIWVLDRGKIVEWDPENRPVRMVGTHADITEKKIAEEKLQFRESFEQLINEVATGMISIPFHDIDIQIENLLKKIGEFIGVDRAYVFLFDPSETEISNTHEWCRNDISPQKENLQNIPVSMMPWWMQKISGRELIIIEDVDIMPPEAIVEKQVLQEQDIKSLIVLPLDTRQKVTGFVGFDAVTARRKWDSDTELLLKNAAITIVSVFLRKEHEISIDKYQNHLESLVKERTAALESSNKELNLSLKKLAKQNHELVKFKTIADKANYPILLLSPEGLVIYSNRMISEITGCPTRNLENCNFINDFIDDEGPNFKKFSQFIKRRSNLKSLDITIRHVTGKKTPALANASAIYDMEGELLFFVLSFTDLTERKKGEQELKILWQAVEHSGNGTLITDKNCRILYANQQYLKTCGYLSSELIGNSPKIVRSYKHSPEFYDQMEQTIHSGQMWKGRVINEKKDRTLYTEDIVISPVHGEDGQIDNFIAITRDITQELRIEQDLQQSEKLRSLGTLAGGIAHDFNNILQVIQVYTELIEYQPNNKIEVGDNIKEIVKACSRGKSLVNNILTFSRQEPNKMSPYTFDFLIKEIIHIVRPIYPNSIEIVQNIESTGMVLCDPVQIQQIIFNLFNNSVDAMTGEGTIRAALRCLSEHERESEHDVLLQISDNGKGMKREVLDRVFDPFFTTKSVGEGTGLGLSSVMGIVKKHNALIKIESEPGKGTTINILFSAIKSNEEKMMKNMKKILLVDDEKAFRDASRKLLEGAGYIVDTAIDGLDAGSYLDKFEYDVIITDIVMPRKEGIQLIRECKQRNLRSKIIAISGGGRASANEYLTMAKAFKADAVLSKPYSFADLVNTLQRLDAQTPGTDSLL